MIDLIIESTFYREIVEKGIEKGVQQGLKQGRTEEAHQLLIRQLTRKFGFIPEPTELRLQALSLEQNESPAEAIFDFVSIEDLKAWLSKAELGLEK